MKLNLVKIGTVAFLMSACGGGGEKSQGGDAGAEFDAAKEQVASDVKKVIDDLPPPSEVPYLLLAAGAEYTADLVNDIATLESYQSDPSKAALNLGVYAADIAYLTSYDMSERALEYMGECQKLAGPVGIADAIDYGMVARFEQNMENKDSLTAIINEVVDKSGDRLSELDQLNSAALMLAGSWIEGMYMSTKIVTDSKVEGLSEADANQLLTPLVQVVLRQKQSLASLMTVLNDVPSNDAIEQMKADLQKVQAIYDGELAEVEKNISENTGNYQLSPSALNSMTAEVGRIRSGIIS